MKVKQIDACASAECPNKPHEGKMVIVTMPKIGKNPRGVTLVMCSPCAEYMHDAIYEEYSGR